VCQQALPTQAIAAEAPTVESAKTPAPMNAPIRGLLSDVMFQPPLRFTAQHNGVSLLMFHAGI
jgi:hypothetical protein